MGNCMHYHLTAIVTLVAVLTYVWMGTRVARTRIRTGILPPLMTGHPELERTIRAHVNTLEWLPVFLPALWLFAVYWGDLPAALIGAVWIAGRVVYFQGYVREAKRRHTGFLIQGVATGLLAVGALVRAIWVLVAINLTSQ